MLEFLNLQINAAVSAIVKREQSGHRSAEILNAQTFRLPVLYLRFDIGRRRSESYVGVEGEPYE